MLKPRVLPDPSSPIGRCEVIVAEVTPGADRTRSRSADWKARPRCSVYPARERATLAVRQLAGSKPVVRFAILSAVRVSRPQQARVPHPSRSLRRVGNALVDARCEMEAAFLVLNCGCSRPSPTQSSSRLSFDENFSCLHPFICFANGSIDPILIPDPQFHGPVAQSTPPSISSARPSLYSTRPPTLPKFPAAPHRRRGPWAE
jgi:hypothetical protein